MEWTSLIKAGKAQIVDGVLKVDWEWIGKTDYPDCTNRVLSAASQRVNDTLDEEANKTAYLIPRLMNARRCSDIEVEERINQKLAIWCAKRVLHLVREEDQEVCRLAIEAAEKCVLDPSEINKKLARQAANAAHAAYYAAYDAAAAAAAAAAAYAAAAAAAAADDATYAAYATADAGQSKYDLVMFLSDLIDYHEKLLAEEGMLWGDDDPEDNYISDEDLAQIVSILASN